MKNVIIKLFLKSQEFQYTPSAFIALVRELSYHLDGNFSNQSGAKFKFGKTITTTYFRLQPREFVNLIKITKILQTIKRKIQDN